ncbi:AsmA family protein [Congregibacter variabilis]|uniref:AsmA family protein n=1 Tax=Congregibacter variabilis TaxID=3081200 RepID=A0ABZ0I5V9_9GAMM|nr:AsmA family protein [Congregibacter sp. IMCC43200]
MRLKTALALLSLALIIGIAVLAFWLRNGMSLGFATPYLEARASELLGRRLSFKDAPSIQIKSGLHIVASNVSLANADWADELDMLQLQSLTAHIDITTLLKDQLVIETLVVNGLELRLRNSVDGLSNLPHIAGDDSEAEQTGEQHPLPVVIKHVQVKHVVIERRNDATEQTVNLTIDSLSQDANSSKSLVYKGNGSLQGKPWQLSLNGSGFNSLRSGLDIFANFNVDLGELRLQGDFQLPNAREIQNLTLNAELDGPIPDRISALSPLLEANEPAQIELRVIDIDPGLRVELSVELQQLDLLVNGDVDDPGGSDGLDLAVRLNAASLPRLTQALGLGQTTDVPLTIDGRLLRKDQHIELRDTVLVAGDHQVRADVVLPSFPGTDGATVNFSAEGPSFAFYQKLFGRRENLAEPYALSAMVVSDIAVGETVRGNLSVGQHRLQLLGLLDNFPSYAGSELSLEFESPSLQIITANAGIELPSDTPLSVTAAISVSDDAVVTINTANINAFDFTSHLSGQFDSYPDFGNADLRFTSDGASLATLGQRLGIHTLGDLPLSFSTDIKGSPREITINNLRLDTGGLQLRSNSGALRYAEDAISSDLRLSVALSDIKELLGSYAPAYSAAGTYRFDLLPQMSSSLFSVGLENLSGPGVSGSARLELASDFQLNEKTLLTADLSLEDLSQLFPPIDNYTPPQQRLLLRLLTRPQKDTTQIDAQLLDANGVLLAAGISLPADREKQSIRVSLKGAGDDLRKLGTHANFPDQQIPYVIDLSATVQGENISADAKKVQLDDNHIHGIVHWKGANKSLTADLMIPSANLQAWLPKDSEADPIAESPATDGRKIPDIALPLEFLHEYHVDLKLETGPLGLADPKFKSQSLVDQSVLQLQIGDGKGQLHIDRIVGSRGLSKADVAITNTQALAEFETTFNVTGMPVAIIAAGTDYNKLPKYDLDAVFEAKGNDLRALAATLNGEFLMTGSAGTLKKMKLSAATESFLAQVLQTLLPMLASGSTNMDVECSVLAARARDGMLTLDPGFVFRSAQLDLSAEGKVNLHNEKLGVRFTNRARKGLGISAASLINPYVEITGTLGKPTLGLDITNSAITGGAAVATGGITLLAKPLYHRFIQKENPCDAALERWSETAP